MVTLRKRNQTEKSGSCHLGRASNVKISVECQIFVILTVAKFYSLGHIQDITRINSKEIRILCNLSPLIQIGITLKFHLKIEVLPWSPLFMTFRAVRARGPGSNVLPLPFWQISYPYLNQG